MLALVVYESMFGNTREIALAVAEGVATHLPVRTTEVGTAPRVLPAEVKLLVVGGPTHARGMSKLTSRADAAGKAGDRLVTRGSGIREWLRQLHLPSADGSSILAATFDTRIKGPRLLWGSAGSHAADTLRTLGFRVVVPPESFLVLGPTGPCSIGSSPASGHAQRPGGSPSQPRCQLVSHFPGARGR